MKLYSDNIEQKLNKEENLWAYCALDCCVTHELGGLFPDMMEPEMVRTYELSKALQGPVFEMMRNGMRIDRVAVEQALYGNPHIKYRMEDCGPGKIYETTAEAKHEVRLKQLGLLARLRRLGGMEKDDTRKVNKWQIVDEDSILQKISLAVSGKTINYQSPAQLQRLLYKDLRLPEQTQRKKGKMVVATNTDALENLAQSYPRAKLVCQIILTCRKLQGLIDVLTKKLDADGNMRCSFNIAGTETGRFSSSASVWDTGTNLQNITPEIRDIFIAEEDHILWNVDLEQAESRGVAYLSGDEGYIKACESGDLHTSVASMIFNIPADKEYADGHIYYKHFTYRDMAKRAGHALNYVLSPHSLARQLKISVKQAFEVYLLYLGGELLTTDAAKMGLYHLPHEKEGKYYIYPGAFPKIKEWHSKVQMDLQMNSCLTTPLGRKRYFWGRTDSMATLREAVAYVPQSMIAEILNMGLLRIYKELPEAQIRSQVHDSVAGQCHVKDLPYVVEQIPKLLHREVEINGRTMSIPCEVKVGYNQRDMRKYDPQLLY